MRKWLESGVGKAAGMALSCLAAAGLALSLMWMGAVSFVEPSDLLLDKSKQSFLNSGTFQNQLRENILQELSYYGERQTLGVSGEINRDALVDVLDFYNYEKITGKNVNGLVYSLGDLLDWGEQREKTDDFSDKWIIVCETPYGNRYYYYMDDLRELLEEGDLTLQWGNSGEETQAVVPGTDAKQLLDFWAEQERQTYYGDVYENASQQYPDSVLDKNGNVVYSSFYLYSGNTIEELYQPWEADSLLEVVNENGWELGEIFSVLDQTINGVGQQVENFESEEYQHAQDSNIQYLYVNIDEKQAFSNRQEFEEVKEWKNSLEKFRQMGSYLILSKGVEGDIFDSNMDGSEDTWRHWIDISLQETVLSDTSYVFAVAIDTSFPVNDWLYTGRTLFQVNIKILKNAIGVCIASIVVFLVSLVWLTLAAGRSRRKEQVVLNFFDRWKTEAAALTVFIIGSCMLAFFLETGILQPEMFAEYLQSSVSESDLVTRTQMRMYTFVVAIVVAVTNLIFLWGYLSLARRCKARTLWKNSILRTGLRQGKKMLIALKNTFFALKDIPRKAAVLGIFLVIQVFLLLWLADISYGGGFLFFCLFLTQAAGVGWIVKVALEYQQIQKGVKKIASGDIAWQIPTQKLTLDRKTLAENINNIGAGLDRAVEESLRSERLKTELITNVSHDIKTPLTSIINYVDLLKREQLPGENVQSYLDILEKKAQQLKTLTEDVVEASKASTGNLKLDYEDLNLVEMILQVNGEFQEKFGQRELELIQRLPENPVVIRADGRRVWRILENIYQNVYKYAMPHTRVYVELETESLRAVFTMKNISQEPLNISPDELTERFIRGDSARNTQGSGLGLSIAKSLTELQAGEFQLFLDGDLFKVWIAFPVQKS